MSIITTLFPPANREAAAVAFLRTFWQAVRSVGGLSVAGGAIITANRLATINWSELGYVAVAVLLSGIVAGIISGGNILANGLPDAYTAAAVPVAPVPAPVLSPTFGIPPVVAAAPVAPVEVTPGIFVAPVVGA